MAVWEKSLPPHIQANIIHTANIYSGTIGITCIILSHCTSSFFSMQCVSCCILFTVLDFKEYCGNQVTVKSCTLESLTIFAVTVAGLFSIIEDLIGRLALMPFVLSKMARTIFATLV